MAVIERPDGQASWRDSRRHDLWRLATPLLLWAVVALGLWFLARYGMSTIDPT